LPFRIFDSWVHEQDMLRALDRPPGDDSPAGALAFERITDLMPMIVGKRAGAPEGSTVEFDITGPIVRRLLIRVDGGRAKFADGIEEPPTVRIRTDSDTFVRLATGRGDPEAILAGSAVAFDGEQALGTSIARAMNFLF
jgi:MDMPI C-terminal domain